MNLSKVKFIAIFLPCTTIFAALFAGSLTAQQPALPKSPALASTAPICEPSKLGSPYIPVDSWIYPAMLRLYSLGYVDTVYLGMRPWTRASVGHMVEQAGARIQDADASAASDEAQGIYDALLHELRDDTQGPCSALKGSSRVESVYTVAREISGTPLRDSFHLGSTIINDYGRPYESGFNNYTGASGYASAGRFVLFVRAEMDAAPSADGYSLALAQALATVDRTFYTNPSSHLTNYYLPQATIPMDPIAAKTDVRLIEAYASMHLLNHEISFGRQDEWLGPGLGGGMAYSNNAANIYSFRINRIEPLRIPLLSRLTGPFRYDFLVGGLRGHNFIPNPVYVAKPSSSVPNVIAPGDPWVHVEKISFRPTENLEFGFERTAIWAGKGHGAVNVKSFLRSFFSVTSPTDGSKNTPDDPGARFAAFDFSYRLPFVRKWLTLYTDSEVHDDVSPADAPRRASYRPGLYLSHVPGVPKLDLRVEAVSTDPSASNGSIQYGHFMYTEGIQKQGYTNQGQMFGDWIGREAKGGQAWVTYHLSGNEWFQAGYRNQKATSNFIPSSTSATFTGSPCSVSSPCLPPGGTTLNDFNLQVVKRIGREFEVNGNFTWEKWKAPIYTQVGGQQTVTATTIQLTWYPERKKSGRN
jgi:hypothetical protein